MDTKIYFDNACTTFPKPASVSEAMIDYIKNIGSNINRGCYNSAYSTEEVVYETRELLNNMFNGEDAKNVIFTKNVTEGLNTVIKGLLKPGDHVIVSSMEHNAVMRPLLQLSDSGVAFDRIMCSDDGSMDISLIEPLIRKETKAVIMLHASNVCGTIIPVKDVGEICKKHGLYFILDSAQTAGTFDIDMRKMNIDALCFTGHKGLMGPQGIGGFILKNHMVDKVTPLISGGTGSISHTEETPRFMPDKFEAGTMNLPGIFGLNATLKWLNERGIAAIREHEMSLTEHMLKELINLEKTGYGIKLIGRRTCDFRSPVISITTPGHELSEIAYRLDAEYGIMTRVGLHCAPSAHKTLNTYPMGTIRFSFGPYNTHDEIDITIDALSKLLKG